MMLMLINLISHRRCNTEFYKYVTLTVFLALSHCKTVSATCRQDEWQCDNGQCIIEDNRCDGALDCSDGSDETAEYCIHMPCKTYAFHCTYGACIAGVDKCNGRKGCADGSDELPLLCGTDSEKKQIEERQRGNCSDDLLLQCKSGECIDVDLKCDGVINCKDGSDEIVEICSTSYCPQFAFRCGYGGCIKGASKCDGIFDCADGSDEASELCGTPRKPPPKAVTTTITATRPPWTILNPPSTDGSCRIPSDRKNLIPYNLEGKILELDRAIPSSWVVMFKCPAKYFLVGIIVNICNKGFWVQELPICTKFCPSLDIRVSVRAICHYENNHIPCANALPSTQASLSCATGFSEPPEYLGITASKFLNCKEDGTWDKSEYRCNMQCGLVAPKTTQFSKGGNMINITDVPWHVGIYEGQVTYNIDGTVINYSHICGGTIIRPNLVISAAHCFWDPANQKLFNESLFGVVAGKYFREYNKKELLQVQRRNVSNIYVNSSYIGTADNFKGDIAVVKLSSPLSFTESIRPICLTFLHYAEQLVENEWTGTFAGWGINENNRQSDVLTSVSMQTLSYGECKARLRKIHPNYELSKDKFCLYDKFGSMACRGDSGGGFVIRITDEQTGKNFYRLVGIVSHGPERSDCATTGFVVMTNVQWFEPLIKPHIDDSEKYF